MAPHSSPLNKEFKPITSSSKTPAVQCVHCQSLAGTVAHNNLRRKKDHLSKCDDYQRFKKLQPEARHATVASSSTLPFVPKAIGHKQQQDRLLARAIYANGHAVSMFDPARHPEWLDFIHSFDGSYQPPSRERLAGDLLDEDYERLRAEINVVLKGEVRINLTADESTAGNSDRVANVAVNTASAGAFHLRTESLGDRNVTAEEVVQLVTSHAMEVTNNDLSRWNSICTDTCSTMRSMHSLLERNAATKHVFSVLCDSHGLQLFVKDILQAGPSGVAYYNSTLADAVFVSNTLRKSKLSLAIIKRVAQERRLPFRAFAVAAITRWGSHYTVLSALVESRELLLQASMKKRLFKNNNGSWITGGERAAALLCNQANFWQRCEHLHSLLQVIEHAQLISEADRSTVGQIISRWDDISEAISDLPIPCTNQLCAILKTRLNKQTTPIHWAARALDPTLPKVSVSFTTEHYLMVRSFLFKHTPPERHAAFNHQLADFRQQRNAFAANQEVWQYAHDYITFWDIAASSAPELSHLAMRLHETPANSVPSERSFSAMNFIQNSRRTRLSTVKTNKLTYIFMNVKALRRKPILESQQHARKQRRQERDELAATRKEIRQQQLELLQAEGVALDGVGAAIKMEQLDDDEVDDLYEQAIAAMPDEGEVGEVGEVGDEIASFAMSSSMPAMPPSLQTMSGATSYLPLAASYSQQREDTQVSGFSQDCYQGDYIDPIFIPESSI
jgi:hypothetical protein